MKNCLFVLVFITSICYTQSESNTLNLGASFGIISEMGATAGEGFNPVLDLNISKQITNQVAISSDFKLGMLSGSGGAIALATTNIVLMLEHAIYSVISPEGCASILWRDPKKTLEAAKAMKLTSNDLLELKIIDEIIKEPSGGAHRDRSLILENVKNSLKKNLDSFEHFSRNEIIEHRKKKFLEIGRDEGFSKNISVSRKFAINLRPFLSIRKIFSEKIYILIIFFLIVLISILSFF